MKLLKNIVSILLLSILGAGSLEAQVPWEYDPSPVTHNIFVESVDLLEIAGVTLVAGDAVGVFFEEGGVLKNGGFTIIEEETQDFVITAHGKEGDEFNGFAEGEPFVFKVWLGKVNCEVSGLEVELRTTNPYVQVFNPQGKSEILSLSGIKASITYPAQRFCRSDISTSPIISKDIGRVNFSVNEGEGLEIDQETGEIALSESQPGIYEVFFEADQCLDTYSFTLQISASPPKILPKEIAVCDDNTLTTLEAAPAASYLWSTGETTRSIQVREPGEYTVEITSEAGCKTSDNTLLFIPEQLSFDDVIIDIEAAACEQNGNVTLEGEPLSAGDEFQFKLVNSVSNISYIAENNQFTSIEEGIYLLSVINEFGCEATLSQDIVIDKIEDCKFPVLSPNGDGVGDTYFIPEQGQAKIYDRNGKLIKTMNIPASWDGTDHQGSILPMGSYILVINGRQEQALTLIR